MFVSVEISVKKIFFQVSLSNKAHLLFFGYRRRRHVFSFVKFGLDNRSLRVPVSRGQPRWMNPFTTWGVAISQNILGILSIFVELLYKDYIARVFTPLIIIIYAVLAQRKIKLGFLFRQKNRSIILKNLLQRCLEIFLANLFVISLNDNHFHFRFIFISRRVTIGLSKRLKLFLVTT